MLGELVPSSLSVNSVLLIREFLGLLPERFDYLNWNVDKEGGSSPLRPELLESIYFLSASKSSVTGWLWSADFSLFAIESLTKTSCGYGIVEQVSDQSTGLLTSDMFDFDNKMKPKSHDLEDQMPSYFLR